MSRPVPYWLTPPEVYEPLHKAYRFDFDPCPHPRPEWDGLDVAWGQSNFVNPPHELGISPWVRKALAERELGKSSVLLLPLDLSVWQLLRSGPAIYPLDPFKWVAPDGSGRRRDAPPCAAFAVHGLPP